jgi:predicted ABC-type ATPase
MGERGAALPETAIERVAYRVSQGGHHVPDDVVRRRFEAGLRNFEALYKPIVDYWALYDNSLDVGEQGKGPVLIEEGAK